MTCLPGKNETERNTNIPGGSDIVVLFFPPPHQFITLFSPAFRASVIVVYLAPVQNIRYTTARVL